MHTISNELAQVIADHITNLIDGEVPTSIEIPHEDRDLVLELLPARYRDHVAAHWSPDDPAVFTDAPEGDFNIPLLR